MREVFKLVRGQGFKTRLLNPFDEIWDRRLGVQTFGFHPGTGESNDADLQVHYTPTPYRDIFRLLKAVDLRNDDVFTDLGAGLGRAVFAASSMGARRAVGIEIVQELCDKAVKNLRRSRLADCNIEFACTNALDYQNSDTTVLFMFHPFGEATLRQVLRNLEVERMQKPHGTLRIIYRNPVYDAVLQQTKWLQCIGRVTDAATWPSGATRYLTTLWQSVP
jgi:16S rRNA G966 N2-methylase RsmD